MTVRRERHEFQSVSVVDLDVQKQTHNARAARTGMALDSKSAANNSLGLAREITEEVFMKKQWTYRGITRFYPGLEFDVWLKICWRGQHYEFSHKAVVEGFI